MIKKVLVLCSGGPDGAVAAAIMQARGYTCEFLHIYYGQAAAPKELEAIRNLSLKMNMPWKCLKVNEAFSYICSSMLEKGPTKTPAEMRDLVAFVPMRNLIFLSLAAADAQERGFGYIATGNIKGGRYWDNQPAFTARMDNLLELASLDGVYVRCIAPCNELTKKEVILKGVELKVPLEDSWSCYLGGSKHCGECASCQGRRKAFIEAGVADPTKYIN